MPAFKYFDPYIEIQKQEGSVATVATVATRSLPDDQSVAVVAIVAEGSPEKENTSPVVCIFCEPLSDQVGKPPRDLEDGAFKIALGYISLPLIGRDKAKG